MNAPTFVGPRPHGSGAADAGFLADVLDGLARPQKTIPAKYFYDLEGSRLFDEITRLPEYYPTRAELAILREHAREIGRLARPGAAVVEFGSGSTEKIRVLLGGMPEVAAYVPVDVSAEFLEAEAARLRADMPDLHVIPIAADFTGAMSLPPDIAGRPLVGFFPGSTIGNFEPSAAQAMLGRFGDLLGDGALLVLGVDLVKSDEVLNAAYDDSAGVTARFNLNLLSRVNRELGADFDLAAFAHRAFFNRELSRIEMHLVSLRAQTVRIADAAFSFAAGETIHTENSYKYTPRNMDALAAEGGWTRVATFTDRDALFAVLVLRRG